METNLYDLTADERARLGIEQLPETLGEAIEEMARSELVLKALGEHVFTRYVDLKRAEWEDYRVQVTPWELDRYLSDPLAPAPAASRRSSSGCAASIRRWWTRRSSGTASTGWRSSPRRRPSGRSRSSCRRSSVAVVWPGAGHRASDRGARRAERFARRGSRASRRRSRPASSCVVPIALGGDGRRKRRDARTAMRRPRPRRASSCTWRRPRRRPAFALEEARERESARAGG